MGFRVLTLAPFALVAALAAVPASASAQALPDARAIRPSAARPCA